MSAREPWAGHSVLIVDDSPAVRESLRQTFQAIGMRVAGTAANGVQALEALEKGPVDLVSLDIIMPEMDGIECYRHIKRENAAQRVVIVSWLGSEPKILENLNGHIPAQIVQAKPVHPDALRQRLAFVYGIAVPATTTSANGKVDLTGPGAIDDDMASSLGIKIVS